MIKQGYVYILASKKNGVLYIGVTSDLVKRIYEHKQGITKGFTSKYLVHRLVYYEIAEDMETAILREKELKHWKREWKIALFEEANPEWEDQYDVICT